MGTRGPKPGSGGRPKKAIADKIADGNAGHRPLTVIDFGDSAADLEGQAIPKRSISWLIFWNMVTHSKTAGGRKPIRISLRLKKKVLRNWRLS